MKPIISIVIPAYNASKTLGRLLVSLNRSRHAPLYEIIAVDDNSTDKTKQIIKTFQKRVAQLSGANKQRSEVRIISFPTHRGPAAARNAGAKKARGKVLLFLDSDIEVFSDTLAQVFQTFSDPDVWAATGVWVKEQKTKKFFPRFKALRDWSYWVNERDQRGYYYLFSTRVAAIRRELFLRLGGFDERYTTPSVEDIDLTYRIARRYAVVFQPSIRVRHEFEDFWPVARKYFRRSREWTALYEKRSKFDPVAATRSEAITALSALGLVIATVLYFLWSFVGLPLIGLLTTTPIVLMPHVREVKAELFLLTTLLLGVHIWGVRKFLRFVYQEEGVIFAVRSFFTGLVLYVVIVAGAAEFFLTRVKKSLPVGKRTSVVQRILTL